MSSCRTLLRPRARATIARWQPCRDCHWSKGSERHLSTVSQIPPTAENGDPYTPDGKERLAGLMQHNIGLYGELQTVKKLRWMKMSVEIAGRHTLQWSDLNYFTTQGLSYAVEVCRRYLADNAKPLWWRTQAPGSLKPVVRNKATARMNVAFRQALHNAGYDIHGRRLPDRQNGPRSGDKAITHLFGTVVIKTHSPVEVHNVPFKDLQDYCKRIVRGVEEALGQGPGDAGRGPQAGPREQDRGRSSGSGSGSGSDGRGGGSRGGRGGWSNKAGQKPRR
ncbi:hypothetical protein F5883DRAFT_529656 [Diaporthe sp. PMI_573]|nr:hypothetical protein F5883DRAFT_529656 [Diaporthaceae sp. PMI_573]